MTVVRIPTQLRELTGGAAEVAYFAQVAVVYEKLLGRVTPVLPRFSRESLAA